MTDKPHLFDSYPARILELTTDKIRDWSLDNSQHFGIKIRGLHWALETSKADRILLLDTDMFWTRDPIELSKLINDESVVMYVNEGPIQNSSNKSINRFQQALDGKKFTTSYFEYQLSDSSTMNGSAILGLAKRNRHLLDEAFNLFSILNPLVDAHTVEQFALSEVFRIRGLEMFWGKNCINDWSSIGRKNYVTPILGEFFVKYGENNFDQHLNKFDSIKIKRPLKVFLKQKISRLLSK